MTDDLTRLSALDATRLLADGELDPTALFDAYRERAAADELNAFTWVADAAPPEPAPRSPLGGVPLGVKDLFCTAGIPSQAGSRILDGYRPPYTATVVDRLAAAGAPLLGKTNQDEFAMGSSTENSAFGPSLNPWDRSRVPGGSSGGSAAAVAAGLVPWALGTDTGGSIRQPAALCGIVGLKPTYGAVSRYGLIAFASSLDQAGPFARDVTDTALLLRHMVGDRDPCDSTSLGFPEEIALPTRVRLDGVRLGVPAELTGEGVEPGVLAAFEATLDLARSLGATVSPCTLPHAGHGLSAYYVIAPAEASSNLARYDGVKFGQRAEGVRSLEEMYARTRGEGFGREPKRRIMLGTYVLRAGYYEAYYGKALRARRKIADDFSAAFASCDVLVTPTSPVPAFRFGERMGDPLQMYLADVLTVAPNLAGIPALAQPCGFTKSGLPIGLQVMGPPLGEEICFRVGGAYEARTQWHERLPADVGGAK
jgi:aspartyl-tRNA(Asn)/glutamyl-tRNA(Gln) amidotransferase subunit A